MIVITPRRSAALLTLSLLGALLVLAPPATAFTPSSTSVDRDRPAGTFVVVDRNVAKKAGVVGSVLNHAKAVDADAVMMQEVCHADVPRIRTAHPSWTVLWMGDHGKCDDRKNEKDHAMGNAVIWTGGNNAGQFRLRFEKSHQTFLPGRKIDSRSNILCAVLPDATRLCSTHLVTKSQPTRIEQANDIRKVTGKWIDDGRTVVVAGDFNNSPTTPVLNPLYANGSHSNGRFYEAFRTSRGNLCRCVGPTATHGSKSKLDYVFASTNAWRSGRTSSLSVTPSKKATGKHNSDHALLTARMDIKT